MTQEQRDGLNDAALALTEPIIEELLKDISRRIKKAGAITDTAEYEIYRAQALGESKKAIARAIARQTEISDEVIDALIEYVEDASVRFEDNAYLQQLTDGYSEITKQKTAEQLQNLWATAPDGKTVPLQDAYARSLDFAFRQTATGALDLNTAIRRAVGPLAERGLRTMGAEEWAQRGDRVCLPPVHHGSDGGLSTTPSNSRTTTVWGVTAGRSAPMLPVRRTMSRSRGASTPMRSLRR